MTDKLCMGCMRKVKGEVCPHCGYNAAEDIQPEFTLLPGTQLHAGKYLVGRVLGQGGFGITYVGLDQSLELKVAVKEYFPTSMASRSTGTATLQWHTTAQQRDAGRESFVREARKMAKIHHIPNVVEVRDVFFENDTAYIIMDFLEGETLKDRLARTGPMDEAGCAALLRPVMESLGKAHERGVVHRDVSPDNIMIDRDGAPWLLDMGAAKELDLVSGSAMQSSQLVVKHGFSPPEQNASAGNIGPWTDVYAMCATIYYCMTGKLLPDAMDRMLGAPLVLPSPLSENMTVVLERGLALRPEDRIQSMDDLLAALSPSAADRTKQKDTETGHEETRETDPLDKKDKDKEAVPDDTDTGSVSEGKEEHKKTLPAWLIPAAGAAAVLAVVLGVVIMNGSRPTVDAPPPGEPTTPAGTAAGVLQNTGGGVTEPSQGGVAAGDETPDMGQEDAGENTPASQPPDQGSTPEAEQPPAPVPQEETYVTNRSFTTSGGSTYSYTGEVRNGQPNGKGTAAYVNGAKYEGEFKDGVSSGAGTYTFASGSKYEGEWKDGKMSGAGTYTWTNGNKYVGEWKDDKRNGTGTMTYAANGDKYEGEWKDDERNGTGTYTFASGSKYEGEWKDGKMSGAGTYTWTNGNKYVGEYENNERNGTGTITYASGDKYEGEWKDDKKYGTGTYIWVDGDKYEGEFDEKMNGTGTYTWANGNKYVGEWKDDKRNGTGTMTWANGDKYVGEWKDDKRNGRGTATYADGTTRVGEWKDGEFVSG